MAPTSASQSWRQRPGLIREDEFNLRPETGARWNQGKGRNTREVTMFPSCGVEQWLAVSGTWAVAVGSYSRYVLGRLKEKGDVWLQQRSN